MRRLLVTAVSFVRAVFTFVAQMSGDTRTAELVAKARAALGGESRLASVKSLSAHGTGSRAMVVSDARMAS